MIVREVEGRGKWRLLVVIVVVMRRCYSVGEERMLCKGIVEREGEMGKGEG